MNGEASLSSLDAGLMGAVVNKCRCQSSLDQRAHRRMRVRNLLIAR